MSRLPIPVEIVRSDVKKPYRRLPLAKKTLVTGSSGSYKSSIGASVMIPLSGKHPVGSNPSDFLRLAADPARGIGIELAAVGAGAEWTLPVDPKTGEAKRPIPRLTGAWSQLTENDRYLIFPTVIVRDLFASAKGDKKLREALIRRFGGDLLDHIPDPVGMSRDDKDYEADFAEWDSAVKATAAFLGDDALPDLILADMSTFFDSEATKISRQITPLEASLANRRKNIGLTVVGGETVEVLTKKLEAARKYRTFAERETLQSLESKLAVVKIEVEKAKESDRHAELAFSISEAAAEKELNDARAKLEAARLSSSDISDKAASARVNKKAYTILSQAKQNKCPYCAHEDDVNVRQVEWTTKELERSKTEKTSRDALKPLEDEVVRLGSKLTDLRIHRAGERAGQKFKNEQLAKDFADLTLAIIEAKKGEIKPPADLGSTDIDVYITQLEDRIGKFKRTTEARSDLERETRAITKLQRRRDILRKLFKQAKAIQREMMTTISERASKELSEAMPDGRKVVIHVDDEDSCELQVVGKDGKPHILKDVASGAEETYLKFALARVWSRGAPLRIAIFDDKDQVGFGEDNYAAFYKACDEAIECGDFDMVIVINNFPKLAPKEGWLVIIDGVATNPEVLESRSNESNEVTAELGAV